MKLFNFIKFCCYMFLLLLIPIFSLAAQTETAIFAAGCFWCAEHDFEQVPGVIKVISGYTGGQTANPSYKEVSHGGTGHFEAVEVVYNPEKVTYTKLLDFFWHNVDPTDAKGQFCDQGDQYRSAIFYNNAHEKQLAETSKNELINSGKFKQIATLVLPASTFYPAEEYHQHYATKNPVRYNFYRYTCGRDARLKEVWSTK